MHWKQKKGVSKEKGEGSGKTGRLQWPLNQRNVGKIVREKSEKLGNKEVVGRKIQERKKKKSKNQ